VEGEARVGLHFDEVHEDRGLPDCTLLGEPFLLDLDAELESGMAMGTADVLTLLGVDEEA